MALFYICVWKGKQQAGSPFWRTSVTAQNMDEGYKIGKDQFETEHPDANTNDYTIIAMGDEVDKSISP